MVRTAIIGINWKIRETYKEKFFKISAIVYVLLILQVFVLFLDFLKIV